MRYLVLATILLFLSSGCGGEEGSETLTFDVKNMTCVSCVQAITRMLKDVDGVEDATVDLESETAVVVVRKGTPVDRIVAGVTGGYELIRRE